MASNYTKVVRSKLWLFRILDFLCLVAPLMTFYVIALCDGQVGTVQKFTCSGLVVIALILTLVNIIGAKRLTCTKWLVTLGLFVAIREFMLPLMILMAITTALDDFLFQTIIQHYKMKLEASKVIDERVTEQDHV